MIVATRSCDLSRVCVVSVPPDVLIDISEPAGKEPIEVEERYAEAPGQKGADRALAGSAGTDQANHRVDHAPAARVAPSGRFRNDGAPARNHGAIMVSKIMQPNAELGMNGQMGLPQR